MIAKPYGNNVLVTGASSGIGLACLLLFSERGYRVWGVSRSGTANQAIPSGARLSSMDVTDDSSVSEGIQRIWMEATAQTGEGIGTVIHCAGFGIGGAAEDTPVAEAMAQFETNYFGVLRVNQALLPLMRARGASLVIVLGSIAGRISIPFQSHYSASKFAIEAYIEALRMEGRPFGIKASVVEAGDTRTGFTGMRRLAIPTDSPYSLQARRSIEKMEKDEREGYPPSTVAKAVYRVALGKRPPVRTAVGFSYKVLMILKRLLPDRVAELVVGLLYLPKDR